jgi:hypothetical protein
MYLKNNIVIGSLTELLITAWLQIHSRTFQLTNATITGSLKLTKNIAKDSEFV